VIFCICIVQYKGGDGTLGYAIKNGSWDGEFGAYFGDEVVVF